MNNIEKKSVAALSVTRLTKIYSNGISALKTIDIAVKPGDFFALLGPNGAGKSTLISILTSLVRKSSGEVLIYGYDIDKDFESAKACLGVVPQEFNFNIFETVEDIMLGQAGYYGIPFKLARERCEHYLRQMHLWERRADQALSLSGGMKRRLMIARALVHQPRMLILDEPTAGVDIEIRHSMWLFLEELNRDGITIILTTHYLEEAERLCRTVAIINEGKIIACDTKEALLNRLVREKFILLLREPYRDIPVVPGYEIVPKDALTLEVEVSRDKGIGVLITSLLQQGIEVISIRNKINQLEQLFLELTTKKYEH